MQGDAAAARGEVLVAGRLAAGQQRADLVDVDELGVLDRAAVDDLRTARRLGPCLRRDDHLVDREVRLAQRQVEGVLPVAERERNRACDIPQARHAQLDLPVGNSRNEVAPFVVRDGPQARLPYHDRRTAHRLARAGVRHAPRQPTGRFVSTHARRCQKRCGQQDQQEVPGHSVVVFHGVFCGGGHPEGG